MLDPCVGQTPALAVGWKKSGVLMGAGWHLPQCLRPSGEEPARHTTQIAAHYGGLNCFRRLLPRGSEGGVDKTPQINIPVGYRLLILNYIMQDGPSANDEDQFDGNTPRTSPKNDLEKLLEVLDKLLHFRWTTDKLLEALTQYRDHHRVRRAFGRFKAYAYGSIFEREDNPIGNKDWDKLLDTHGLNHATRLLRCEIKALTDTECFGQYSSDESTGSLTHIDKMVDTIKSTAPRWVSILQNSSYPPQGNPTSEVPFSKFTVILSMLCNHMHRNTSDAFPRIMSLYLFQAGCRRRGIDLFNCLGLCQSFEIG